MLTPPCAPTQGDRRPGDKSVHRSDDRDGKDLIVIRISADAWDLNGRHHLGDRLAPLQPDHSPALSRMPQHGDHGRASPGLGLASDNEPETLVEGDVPGIGGIEICGQMILIDDLEAVLHQLAAEASALHDWVDPEPR
jgi:hypothetical protein